MASEFCSPVPQGMYCAIIETSAIVDSETRLYKVDNLCRIVYMTMDGPKPTDGPKPLNPESENCTIFDTPAKTFFLTFIDLFKQRSVVLEGRHG